MRVTYANNQVDNYYRTLQTTFKKVKPKYRSRFLVNKGHSYIKVDVDDIAYFHISNQIIYAITFNNIEYRIDSLLKTLEMELNPEVFKRVNRQVILNINCIERIEPYFQGKLVVKTLPKHSEKIIVSQLNSKPLKDWIDQ